MLGFHPTVLFQAINDSNQLQTSINNVLDVVVGVTGGLSNQATNIGDALGIVVVILVFTIALVAILRLLPTLWKGLTGWFSDLKMPGD